MACVVSIFFLYYFGWYCSISAAAWRGEERRRAQEFDHGRCSRGGEDITRQKREYLKLSSGNDALVECEEPALQGLQKQSEEKMKPAKRRHRCCEKNAAIPTGAVSLMKMSEALYREWLSLTYRHCIVLIHEFVYHLSSSSLSIIIIIVVSLLIFQFFVLILLPGKDG